MDKATGIEVLIPVLVDSDGRWMANGTGKGDSPYTPEECQQPDWGLMDDCLIEMDDGLRSDGTRQVWVKAYLPLPVNDMRVTSGQTIPMKD